MLAFTAVRPILFLRGPSMLNFTRQKVVLQHCQQTLRTTINFPDILHITKLNMVINSSLWYFIHQISNQHLVMTPCAIMYNVQHQRLSYKCTPLHLIITVLKYANSLCALPQYIHQILNNQSLYTACSIKERQLLLMWQSQDSC